MLTQYVRTELANNPKTKWHHSFPVQVAVLRFLEQKYPEKVALRRADFSEDGPSFSGRGVEWFSDEFWRQSAVLDCVDDLMTSVEIELRQRYPRDTETFTDIPLDREAVAQLEYHVIENIERALREGRL